MSSGKSLLSAVGVSVALATLGALSMGCGGIHPGDYIILRLSESAPTLGSDCNTMTNYNVMDSSSNVETSATAYIFAGPDNKLYLDTGMAVLAGATSSGGYTFSDKTVAVTWGNPKNGTGDENTDVKTLTVNMTVSGNAVNGTSVSNESVSCAGKCPGFTPSSCTTTVNFSGEEVQNVQLQHQVP